MGRGAVTCRQQEYAVAQQFFLAQHAATLFSRNHGLDQIVFGLRAPLSNDLLEITYKLADTHKGLYHLLLSKFRAFENGSEIVGPLEEHLAILRWHTQHLGDDNCR